jgi:hypothetical protein
MMDVADLSGPYTEASLAWDSRALNRAPPESRTGQGDWTQKRKKSGRSGWSEAVNAP